MPFRWRAVVCSIALPLAAAAAERSVTIRVAGWHSKGDAWRTESAIRGLKGVRQVETDAGKQQVTVVFDDAVATRARIEKAIADAGYSVAK
jgi:copper chaperone CopZ